MYFSNVHIQRVSTISSKCLVVVIAVAGEVLNMVVQVTFIVATLSTDSAYIGPQLTLRELRILPQQNTALLSSVCRPSVRVSSSQA